MASALQNRIVGTAIVFALAIIILPDLLSGKNYTPEDDFQVSPLRPVSESTIHYPEFPNDFSERSAPQPRMVIDEEEFLVHEPQEGQINPPVVANNVATAELNEGWVIQLGAFRNHDRVAELVQQLRSEGYPAYSRNVTNSSGEALTLLMVGPDVNAAKLQEQLADLREISGLSGRVVEYRPQH